MGIHSQGFIPRAVENKASVIGHPDHIWSNNASAPANLLIAIKQKAYIALLKAILHFIIPFLLLISNFKFQVTALS